MADGPDDLAELCRLGRAALASVRPGTEPAGEGGVRPDDWGSQRGMAFDHALVNRWKTACLRALRARYGETGAPYREFCTVVERAAGLWRAVEPGLQLLERLRAEPVR